MKTKRAFVLKTRKRQLKFLRHITGKKDLGNLTLTGLTEGKRKDVSNLVNKISYLGTRKGNERDRK